MSYAAVIAKVRKIRPLIMKDGSEANNVNLATVCGYQVIVSKATEEDTLGIYFPTEGQLSREMCMENNLYRKHPDTDEPMGGYFGKNGRVRVQKFLGHESWGFWTPISSLEWTVKSPENIEIAGKVINPHLMKEGTEITDLNDHNICQKYFSPRTIAAMRANNKTPKMRFSVDSFPKHYDTAKLRISGRSIEAGSVLYFTEKVHGTSGRAGNLSVTRPLSQAKKLWNSVAGVIGTPKFSEKDYVYLSGTRNTVRNPFAPAYEGGLLPDLRTVVDDELKSLGIRKGETLYFEIVGYDPGNALIMGAHPISDKALKKRYGDSMMYRYGCRIKPYRSEEGDKLEYPHRILVYRITQQGPDGNTIELSQAQLKSRCDTLGMETVPLLSGPIVYDGDLDNLLQTCEELSRGDSVLDDTHIREGVVVRIEGPRSSAMKYKSFWFCTLEGIKKNDDSYVDPEEIS
jgi:hypothetical protein